MALEVLLCSLSKPSKQPPITEKFVTNSSLQELRIDGFSTQSDVNFGHVSATSSGTEFTSLVASTIASLPFSISNKSLLTAKLISGLQDAEVAILLCLCPNIEVLDITAVYGIDGTFVMGVIEDARGQIMNGQTGAPVHRLRELRSEHWGTLTLNHDSKTSLTHSY